MPQVNAFLILFFPVAFTWLETFLGFLPYETLDSWKRQDCKEEESRV
jgi:hypothetical protein